MMGMAMGTGEKSKNFRASFGRLLGRLRPEAPLIVLVICLAVISVFFAILGPKILGDATNVIFNGVIGKQIPAGVTQEQAVAGLRASGQTQLADMLASMTVTPGQGVDFGALARHPRSRSQVCTSSARSSRGDRPGSWPVSPSGRCTASAATSTRSSPACRSATSTRTPAGIC